MRPRVIVSNVWPGAVTKGRVAMAMAMIYPEPGKGGRGKKSEAGNSAGTAGFSARRVQDARTILRHSRALAEAVLKGARSLSTWLLWRCAKPNKRSAARKPSEGGCVRPLLILPNSSSKGRLQAIQLSASSAALSPNCSAISKRILRSASFLISTPPSYVSVRLAHDISWLAPYAFHHASTASPQRV